MAASITCWQRNSWLVLNKQFESQSNHTEIILRRSGDQPEGQTQCWGVEWSSPQQPQKTLDDSLGFGGIAASLVVVGVQSLHFYQKACLTCKPFLVCCLIFPINSLHCLPFESVACSDLRVKSVWKPTKDHSFISSLSIPKLAEVPKAF